MIAIVLDNSKSGSKQTKSSGKMQTQTDTNAEVLNTDNSIKKKQEVILRIFSINFQTKKRTGKYPTSLKN